MKKELLLAVCVGIFGVILMANTTFAGEREFFTEEDIQDEYRLVESLPLAPTLGNITRANVWIKDAYDRIEAKEETKKQKKIESTKIVVAKAPAPAPAPTAPPKVEIPTKNKKPQVSTQVKPAENYKVQSGDTLFGIVEKLDYKSIDKSRTAVALWQSNKHCFIAGNLNGIIPGKTLELTEVAKNIEGIDKKTASGIVKSQWKEWKNRNKPALKTKKDAIITEEKGSVASVSKLNLVTPEPKQDRKPVTGSNLIKN